MRHIPGADRVRQVFPYTSQRGDVEIALVPVAADSVWIGDDELLCEERRGLPGGHPQLMPKDRRAGDRKDHDGGQRGVETLTPSASSS